LRTTPTEPSGISTLKPSERRSQKAVSIPWIGGVSIG
jgi:hypothetical protein